MHFSLKLSYKDWPIFFNKLEIMTSFINYIIENKK